MSSFAQVDFCNPTQLTKEKTPNSPKSMSKNPKLIASGPVHPEEDLDELDDLNAEIKQDEEEEKETILVIEDRVKSVSYAANATLREVLSGKVVLGIDKNARYTFDSGDVNTTYHHLEAAAMASYENQHFVTLAADCDTFKLGSDYRRMTQNGTEGCAILERNTKETHLKDSLVIRPDDSEQTVPQGVHEHPGYTKENIEFLGVTPFPNGKQIGFNEDHPVVLRMNTILASKEAKNNKTADPNKNYMQQSWVQEFKQYVIDKAIGMKQIERVIQSWHDHINIQNLRFTVKPAFSVNVDELTSSQTDKVTYPNLSPAYSRMNNSDPFDIIESNILDLETSCPTSGGQWKAMLRSSLDTKRRIGFTIVYKYKAYIRQKPTVKKE